jgi:hypothetical protein
MRVRSAARFRGDDMSLAVISTRIRELADRAETVVDVVAGGPGVIELDDCISNGGKVALSIDRKSGVTVKLYPPHLGLHTVGWLFKGTGNIQASITQN